MANLEHDIPIDGRTAFNLASVSKQFTAATVLALAGEGQLALTDNIRKYIPEIPAYERPILVTDLVHHTSGIREYTHLLQLAGRDASLATSDEILHALARQRALNFDPGLRASYSNSNYVLLGVLVARVANSSLREAADRLVFGPAGMTGAQFRDDPREVIKHRATGYSVRHDGGFAIETAQRAVVGNGGVYATVQDLVTWEQYLLAHPELSRLTVAGTLRSGESSPYAFGLEVDEHRGLPTIGHGGSFNGYSADVVRFPTRNISVICLCNLFGVEAARTTRKLADIFIGDDFPAPAVVPAPLTTITVSVADLEQVTGIYVNPDTNNIRRIMVRDGQLIYSRGTSESTLAPTGKRRFVMRGVPDVVEIRFEPEGGSKPLRMITTVNAVHSTTHLARPAARHSPEELQHFVGVYSSDELQVRYHLLYRDGKLYLNRPGLDETALVAEYGDAFSVPGSGLFEFTRNDGRITGFAVGTGRAQGIRFEKIEEQPRTRPHRPPDK